MKISQIISSYNRPCQLDLLLRSCQDHWPECTSIIVLGKFVNDMYGQGYEKVFFEHHDIKFYKESDYKKNLIDIISDCPDDYILMNSDDNVFINEVNFHDHTEMMLDDHVAFSLRLGENINYCLPAKLKIDIPQFQYWDYTNFISWDWTKCDRRGTYGYPQPYDSNIYRKDWLINLIKDKEFKNPFTLENVLNTNRDTSKPYMVAFKEPKLISIMANTTAQNDNPNMKGNGQGLEMLNKKWLDGWQIKTEGIYGMKTQQCHVFYQYEFEKE